MDEAFGHWLAGFVDGEGCFQIAKSSPSPRQRVFSWRCSFQVCLRADDAPILHEIQRQTGLGTVKLMPPRGVKTWNVSVRWNLTSKRDCAALARLFERYPLRAKKAADFLIWREAVSCWLTKRKGGPHNRALIDWSDMAALAEQLLAIREYDGPVESDVPVRDFRLLRPEQDQLPVAESP